MQSGAPTPLEFQQLEDQIHHRLHQIKSLQNRKQYQMRVCKSGGLRKSPIQIFTPFKQKSNSLCFHDADYLAHIFSLAQFKLPLSAFQKISSILVIPEYIHNQQYLLSHIYSPAEQCLAIYLYPRIFNQSPALNLEYNTSLTAASLDGPTNRLKPESSPHGSGIMERVLYQISLLPPQKQLHYWLISFNEIDLENKLELEKNAEIYQRLQLSPWE